MDHCVGDKSVAEVCPEALCTETCAAVSSIDATEQTTHKMAMAPACTHLSFAGHPRGPCGTLLYRPNYLCAEYTRDRRASKEKYLDLPSPRYHTHHSEHHKIRKSPHRSNVVRLSAHCVLFDNTCTWCRKNAHTPAAEPIISRSDCTVLCMSQRHPIQADLDSYTSKVDTFADVLLRHRERGYMRTENHV